MVSPSGATRSRRNPEKATAKEQSSKGWAGRSSLAPPGRPIDAIRTGATMLQSLGEGAGAEAGSASTRLALSSARQAPAAASGDTEGAAAGGDGAGAVGGAPEDFGGEERSGGRTGGRGRGVCAGAPTVPNAHRRNAPKRVDRFTLPGSLGRESRPVLSGAQGSLLSSQSTVSEAAPGSPPGRLATRLGPRHASPTPTAARWP